MINLQGDFSRRLIFRIKLLVSLVPYLPRKGKLIQILVVVGSMTTLLELFGLGEEGLNNVKYLTQSTITCDLSLLSQLEHTVFLKSINSLTVFLLSDLSFTQQVLLTNQLLNFSLTY